MTSLTSQPVLVSIVMPLYNAERYVFAALQSILRERSISLEVIVVNDGSTDHSLREVYRLKDNRIRVVQNTGKGIAAALNTGLAAAQGSIFMRCDADDLYPMHRFSQQIHWLQNHPEIVAVCGNYEAIDSRGTSIIQFWCGTEAEDISVELRNGISRTHLCTFAVRTEVLRQLGGFRSYFVTAEDIDMQLRIAEVGQVWYLPDVSYRYRIHDSSITHTKSSSEREFFDFVVREFQRQRQDTGEDDLQRG
ncbi:MAG TPA: glycosyltransferase family A protein, partial [Allocoleopsis sp.]